MTILSTGHADVNAAAERLGVSTDSIRSYIRSGKLPAQRIGKAWAIALDDLDALGGGKRRPATPSDARHAALRAAIGKLSSQSRGPIK